MLQALLLSAIVSTAAAMLAAPNCSSCSNYDDGICYVKSSYCSVYFVCEEADYAPGTYTYQTLCCAGDLTFHLEHLTCAEATEDDANCIDDRSLCPQVFVKNDTDDCPYEPHPGSNSRFQSTNKYDVFQCPQGQVWDQTLCTCNGKAGTYCNKVLQFDFNGDFESWTCGTNFARGQPVNDPSVSDDVLELNFPRGGTQFVKIPYIANWWAWNPVGSTFTMCFWLTPFFGPVLVLSQAHFGVLSTGRVNGKVMMEFYIEELRLYLSVGDHTENLGVSPSTGAFSKVCATFDRGFVTAYFNGAPVRSFTVNSMPVNNQAPTTIGFVEGRRLFRGWMDDFCLWNTVLSADEIAQCYADGPSTNFTIPVIRG